MDLIAGKIITACWIIFIIFWTISALRVKHAAQRQSYAESLSYRIPFIAGGGLLFYHTGDEGIDQRILPDTAALWMTGAAVCVLGVVICVWARVTLAGNWSSDVSFKVGHELVRRGPYRFVRHPIYTGLLAMCVGTAMDIGRVRCIIGLVFLTLALWIKLKYEEKLMLEHFPADYPIYQKEVKALVPWLV